LLAGRPELGDLVAAIGANQHLGACALRRREKVLRLVSRLRPEQEDAARHQTNMIALGKHMKVGDRRVGTSVAGRFRIESLIGEGQMARVYVAEQMSMKRHVALKIMHSNLLLHKAAPMRFRREVEAVTRLRSQHSIVVYDFGSTDDGSLFIAMELLQGEPLRMLLDRERGLAPSLVLWIVRQICGCLREAHQAGVLHRDLKPENIFLCPPEAGTRGPFVKVLD